MALPTQSSSMADAVVLIGDKIRFSVELIRDIASMPDRSTQLLRVVEIRTEEDGTKYILVNTEVSK